MTNGKFKAHTIYRNHEGIIVPGVTTITGELGWSREQLCRWHNKMGLEGIDTKKYVDDKADIGTLAHLIIANQLQGKKTRTDDYSKNQIKSAKNSVKSFNAWAKDKKIEPILIETQLVSEIHGFGGTADILAFIDDVIELIDLKSGKGIYDEHFIQVGGGYDILLKEHNYFAERIRILNIPRTDNEKFDEKEITNREVCKDIFLNCLRTYKLKKLIKEVA